MGKSYTKLENLLPGVSIGRFAHSRFVYVRLYEKDIRSVLAVSIQFFLLLLIGPLSV